jgi:hypothetical protein
VVTGKMNEVKWKYNIGDRIVRQSADGEIECDFVITDRVAKHRKEKKKNGAVWNHLRHYYEYSCNICGAKHLWKDEKDVEKSRCLCCASIIRIKGINTIGDVYPDFVKYFANKDDAFDPKNWLRSRCDIKCPVCGHIKNMRIDGLIRGHFYCDHCNCVAIKRPDLVRYFANKKDAEKITYGSNKKVLLKCPDCGKERLMDVNRLSTYGFCCDACSDGISFPEKFVMAFLKQLNIPFIYQLTSKHFEWCGTLKYDFCVEDKVIIETHGMQHYIEKSSFSNKVTFEEIQANDEYKKNLAMRSNIKEYIVLDCRWSDTDWIKNSILNSRLAKLYDLSHIDWDACAAIASKNILKEVCEYWAMRNSSDCKISDLVKIFHLSYCTIQNYLKLGGRIGWCNYDPKKEKAKAHQKSADTCAMPVVVLKDGISVGAFQSIRELERQSLSLYGVQFHITNITRVCKGKQKHHKGFTFRYAEN